MLPGVRLLANQNAICLACQCDKCCLLLLFSSQGQLTWPLFIFLFDVLTALNENNSIKAPFALLLFIPGSFCSSWVLEDCKEVTFMDHPQIQGFVIRISRSRGKDHHTSVAVDSKNSGIGSISRPKAKEIRS